MNLIYFVQGGCFNVFGTIATPTGRWRITSYQNGTDLYLEMQVTRHVHKIRKKYWWDFFDWYSERKVVDEIEVQFIHESNISWYIEYDVQECQEVKDES